MFSHGKAPRYLKETANQLKRNGKVTFSSIILPNGLKLHQAKKDNPDFASYCHKQFGKNEEQLLLELTSNLNNQLDLMLIKLHQLVIQKDQGFRRDFKSELEAIESVMADIAKQGLLDAQVQLGLLYFMWGTEFGRSEYDGLSWMKKAFKSGHSDAPYELGVYHLRHSQFHEALKCFKVGDKQGCAFSRFHLARMYENGAETAVPKNLQKAFGLYKRASGGGHPKATVNMVKMVISNEYAGKLPAEPKALLEEAIKDGDSEAQFLLGYLYEEGITVPKSLRTAIDFFKCSAEKGCDFGQLHYGYILEKGKEKYPVEANINEAIFWYEKASTSKTPQIQKDANFNLGNCYLKLKNLVKAHFHFQQACSLGDEDAREMMKLIAEHSKHEVPAPTFHGISGEGK
ncbi:sel1 repeat family protein [Vibrio parahaemolyticus]|nr:sel1 repeat family protein [Vibrio parahaemolyticus]